jgi:hypothetical protein
MEQTGFSWLRIESCGKLLWAQLWTFGFHIESWLFDKLSDYQLFKEYPAPWSEWVSICILFNTALLAWVIVGEDTFGCILWISTHYLHFWLPFTPIRWLWEFTQ